MLTILAILGALGWTIAGFLYRRICRHVCPIEPPNKAVLLNYSGLPESCRTLKGVAPKTYSRPRGAQPATLYARVGTAALYQATTPRQSQ